MEAEIENTKESLAYIRQVLRNSGIEESEEYTPTTKSSQDASIAAYVAEERETVELQQGLYSIGVSVVAAGRLTAIYVSYEFTNYPTCQKVGEKSISSDF